MKLIFTLFFSLALSLGFSSPKESLEKLMKGNKRFADGKLLHKNRDQERRDETRSGQNPFAIVLSCSDSRVVPEILFDQGIGDLFVVRVAGNIATPTQLESIAYAALYLGSELLVVLGHENCGAVDAVLKGNTKDIPVIANKIQPAISKGANLPTAIKDNVKYVTAQLKNNTVLLPLIEKKTFMVVGGVYDLKTGKVTLSSHE